MQRTLQTADQALGWLMKRGVPAIVKAEWQETTVNKCDIGRPIPEVSAEWPQFDWSEIDPKFPAKDGLYEFSQAALIKRGIFARRWLKARPEKVIAVVSHAGFLRTGICNRKFDNADFRVFEFEEGEEKESEGPRLIESELTAQKGGGMGRSPDGYFGWEVNDFKYMPENMRENSAQEEVVKT
jgi:broad specificity phosphatase PhoE